MQEKYQMLIINPGSTSTKIAVFAGEQLLLQDNIIHSSDELNLFPGIMYQLSFRRDIILSDLKKSNIDVQKFSAVVGRGGLLEPLQGGTYLVNEQMVKDLRSEPRGSHASNLGGIIAYELANLYGIPAYVVDPVTVDEMEPQARISGLPEIPRVSIFHALNQKATARRVAREFTLPYEDMNIIVAHMGGGISIGAHKKGKVIDVNNAIAGDGPFSPERAGVLPVGGLVDLCFSGYTKEEVMKKLIGQGGLVAHLGTNSAAKAEEMAARGDNYATIVYEAMAYQVAKAIGSCAAVLGGEVDAIVITGGIANSTFITDYITKRVKFIAPVFIYPGEDEMSALAAGGLRVLQGKEEALIYQGGKGSDWNQEYLSSRDITAVERLK